MKLAVTPPSGGSSSGTQLMGRNFSESILSNPSFQRSPQSPSSLSGSPLIDTTRFSTSQTAGSATKADTPFRQPESSTGSGSLLWFILALGIAGVLTALLVRHPQAREGNSSGDGGTNRDTRASLPRRAQSLFTPSHHTKIHDERYLRRILEAELGSENHHPLNHESDPRATPGESLTTPEAPQPTAQTRRATE
jgi:hypothetical protein